MPVVDFSVIQERSFEPFDDGTYDARLSAWELRKGNKGDYYNLEFTFFGNEALGNRKIWAMSSISDGALWRFKRDMIALGADPDDLAPGSQVDTDDIVEGRIGEECRLTCVQEDYTKKDGTPGRRSVVKEILSPLPF